MGTSLNSKTRMNNKLTVLLVSYDGYGDMWPAFFECKKKFWSDCPYPTVLANNEKSFTAENTVVMNCGRDAQWSMRTRKALEKIDTKYVMFLLEDLFISDNVDTRNVESAISIMEDEGIDYYKIMTFSDIKTKNFKDYDFLKTIPASLPYGISLQASIWNRNFFLKMIGEGNYNPWCFETRRLKEEQTTKEPNKLIGVFDNRNILNICHMVVQGKYLPKSVIKMQGVGINVDVESREVMSYSENCIYDLKLKVSSFTDRHTIIRKFLRMLGPSSVVKKNS